jgi:hypothetical protein
MSDREERTCRRRWCRWWRRSRRTCTSPASGTSACTASILIQSINTEGSLAFSTGPAPCVIRLFFYCVCVLFVCARACARLQPESVDTLVRYAEFAGRVRRDPRHAQVPPRPGRYLFKISAAIVGARTRTHIRICTHAHAHIHTAHNARTGAAGGGPAPATRQRRRPRRLRRRAAGPPGPPPPPPPPPPPYAADTRRADARGVRAGRWALRAGATGPETASLQATPAVDIGVADGAKAPPPKYT